MVLLPAAAERPAESVGIGDQLDGYRDGPRADGGWLEPGWDLDGFSMDLEVD